MKNLKFLSVCVALTMLFSACNRDLLDQDEGGGVKGSSKGTYTVESAKKNSTFFSGFTNFECKSGGEVKDASGFKVVGVTFKSGKLTFDATAEIGTYEVAFYDDDQQYWWYKITITGPCSVSLVSTGQNSGNNAVKIKVKTPEDLRPYWRVNFVNAKGESVGVCVEVTKPGGVLGDNVYKKCGSSDLFNWGIIAGMLTPEISYLWDLDKCETYDPEVCEWKMVKAKGGTPIPPSSSFF